MAHILPNLSFEKGSLAPWTSAETLEYHHGKHHAGYVNKLNTALETTDLRDSSLEEVVVAARRSNSALYNLAAQHFNHSFFWNCLSGETQQPSGQLGEFINRDFGSFDAFKEQFGALALKHFGSGWVWLLADEDGKLSIQDYHDADTPAETELKPILTIDVWEHAYYVDYRNDRGKFIEGFWNHVNWGFAGEQFGKW
jgi:superoxide dismutase, Fe-Mn family